MNMGRDIDTKIFAENYQTIKAYIPYWIAETRKRLKKPRREIVGGKRRRDCFLIDFRDEFIESELVQQALLLTRHFRGGDFTGYLHTYLVKKTVNALYSEVMRLNRELPLSFIIPEGYDGTDAEWLDTHSTGYANLATQGEYERLERRDTLERLVENATPLERQIMSLVMQGLPYREIARRLGLPSAMAVKRRLEALRRVTV